MFNKAILLSFSLFLLAGCGQSGSTPQVGTESQETESGGPAQPAVKTEETTPVSEPARLPRDVFHAPFAEAIRPEPPENALPPVQTKTGKSVGKIYGEVEKQWSQIRFVTADGKKLQYRATLETDLGTIQMELLHDLAPNHVRSFVALARAGYYDGLAFEDAISGPEKADANYFQAVIGGSPEGDGNPISSVGYWLLPETEKQAELVHQPGTVGAYHGPELDTACCRFYITLTPAPLLDGNYTIFGRVTHGLEAAKEIFNRLDKSDDLRGLTPPARQPPAIRKVTISVQPLEK